MSCAIFLTNDEPKFDVSFESIEWTLDPPDGLRGGCAFDVFRVGSTLEQLFGTLTTQRL